MWVPISEYGLLANPRYKYLILTSSPDTSILVAGLLRLPGDSFIWAGSSPDRIRGKRPPTYRIIVEIGWFLDRKWTVLQREIDQYLKIWHVKYPNTIRTIDLDHEYGRPLNDFLQESERPVWMAREHVPPSRWKVQDSRSLLPSSPLHKSGYSGRDIQLLIPDDCKDDS